MKLHKAYCYLPDNHRGICWDLANDIVNKISSQESFRLGEMKYHPKEDADGNFSYHDDLY